jgi:Uri superfamily endonuclease
LGVSCTAKDSGLYVVLVDVRRPVQVSWGGHETVLPKGNYAYAGSARRGLRARVARHFRRQKPRTWHVDQLTTGRHATVMGAVLLPNTQLTECGLNMTVGWLVAGSTPAPRFGASDCRAGCPAHLWKCTNANAAAPKDIAAMLLRASGIDCDVLVHHAPSPDGSRLL